MRLAIALAIVLALLMGWTALAEDIYVSQSGSGLVDGTSCANAQNMAWLNTAGNWGVGAGKVSPGDTVHLCGTWSFGADATAIVTAGNGSSGNPVTFLFEPGCTAFAQYFDYLYGFIRVPDNFHDFVIDGGTGTNGVIYNTSNGDTNSGLAFHSASSGIYISGYNVEIRSMWITNIFYNKGGSTSANDPDQSGGTTQGIFLNHACTNILIHHCYVYGSRSGIGGGPNGGDFKDIEICSNTLANADWQIALGSGGSSNSAIINLKIHHNDISDWLLWGYPYHTDGIIIFADTTDQNSRISGSISNNYFHGWLSGESPTAYIGAGANMGNLYVNNNLAVCAVTNCPFIWINDAASAAGFGASGRVATNVFIYNNTIVGTPVYLQGLGAGQVNYAIVTGGTNICITNNIIINYNVAYRIDDAPISADYNLLNVNYGRVTDAGNNPTNLATWISTGMDTHSLTNVNPNFKSSTDFHLTGSSPSILAGANLSSFFQNDFDNVSRPLAGTNWDIGAYQYLVASGSPEIFINPSSLSYGTLIRVGSPSLSITVSNAGGGTLNGNATSDSGNFVVTAGSGYGIAGGTAASVTVQFAPAGVAGTYSGNLTLTGGGGAVVPMSGVATNFPTVKIQ